MSKEANDAVNAALRANGYVGGLDGEAIRIGGASLYRDLYHDDPDSPQHPDALSLCFEYFEDAVRAAYPMLMMPLPEPPEAG